MTEQRNKGGRPRGSGIDDGRDLDAVADLMVREPGLKKTPAIARVVQDRHPQHQWQAVERRLLRKWNATDDERMAAARERRAARRSVSSMTARELALTRGLGLYDDTGAAFLAAAKAHAMNIEPALRQLQSLAQSNTFAQARELASQLDSPALRQAMEEMKTQQRLWKAIAPIRFLRP